MTCATRPFASSSAGPAAAPAAGRARRGAAGASIRSASLLAGVALVFLLGLVYLGQTVNLGATNYEIDSLLVERDDLTRQVKTAEAGINRYAAEQWVLDRGAAGGAGAARRKADRSGALIGNARPDGQPSASRRPDAGDGRHRAALGAGWPTGSSARATSCGRWPTPSWPRPVQAEQRRGDITDRSGTVLATTAYRDRLVAYPDLVPERPARGRGRPAGRARRPRRRRPRCTLRRVRQGKSYVTVARRLTDGQSAEVGASWPSATCAASAWSRCRRASTPTRAARRTRPWPASCSAS